MYILTYIYKHICNCFCVVYPYTYIKLNMIETLHICLDSSLARRPDIMTCFSSLFRFQVFLYFTCAIQNTACGMHYLAAVFLTLHPKHTCRPPGNVSQIVFHNTSVWKLDDIWTQFSIGRGDYIVVQLYDGDVWELTGCYRYRRENKSSLNYDYDGLKSSSPCVDGFIYDRSKWDNTVVTQWNLVCNREWFASLIQPTFMFGVLLGALAFGYLSDR